MTADSFEAEKAGSRIEPSSESSQIPIEGRDWKKEIGNVSNDPSIRLRRAEFYEKNAKTIYRIKEKELSESNTLKNFRKWETTVEAGASEKLYDILIKFFSEEGAPMIANEVRYSLMILSEHKIVDNKNGVNVDNIWPGDKITIEKGKLSITRTFNGKTKVFTGPLRPEFEGGLLQKYARAKERLTENVRAKLEIVKKPEVAKTTEAVITAPPEPELVTIAPTEIPKNMKETVDAIANKVPRFGLFEVQIQWDKGGTIVNINLPEKFPGHGGKTVLQFKVRPPTARDPLCNVELLTRKAMDVPLKSFAEGLVEHTIDEADSILSSLLAEQLIPERITARQIELQSIAARLKIKYPDVNLQEITSTDPENYDDFQLNRGSRNPLGMVRICKTKLKNNTSIFDQTYNLPLTFYEYKDGNYVLDKDAPTDPLKLETYFEEKFLKDLKKEPVTRTTVSSQPKEKREAKIRPIEIPKELGETVSKLETLLNPDSNENIVFNFFTSRRLKSNDPKKIGMVLEDEGMSIAVFELYTDRPTKILVRAKGAQQGASWAPPQEIDISDVAALKKSFEGEAADFLISKIIPERVDVALEEIHRKLNLPEGFSADFKKEFVLNTELNQDKQRYPHIRILYKNNVVATISIPAFSGPNSLYVDLQNPAQGFEQLRNFFRRNTFEIAFNGGFDSKGQKQGPRIISDISRMIEFINGAEGLPRVKTVLENTEKK